MNCFFHLHHCFQEDPFAEFKKVFEKFASAEQVTGLAPLDDEDDQADQVLS